MRSAHPYQQGLEKNSANFVALSPLSYIARSAHVYPDRLAVIYGERRQTWAATYTRWQIGKSNGMFSCPPGPNDPHWVVHRGVLWRRCWPGQPHTAQPRPLGRT